MKKEKLFSMFLNLIMVVIASVMSGGMAMAVTPEDGDDTDPSTTPEEGGESGGGTEPEPEPEPEPSDTGLLASSLVNRRKRRIKKQEAKRSRYTPKPFVS